MNRSLDWLIEHARSDFCHYNTYSPTSTHQSINQSINQSIDEWTSNCAYCSGKILIVHRKNECFTVPTSWASYYWWVWERNVWICVWATFEMHELSDTHPYFTPTLWPLFFTDIHIPVITRWFPANVKFAKKVNNEWKCGRFFVPISVGIIKNDFSLCIISCVYSYLSKKSLSNTHNGAVEI